VDLQNAEIDRLIATAHKYPRRHDIAVKKMQELACYDEASAENCVYALPRGGKAIVGPSVGFANIVADSWGNCFDYGRWVYTDRKEKVVVTEGIFINWENNRRLVISDQRRIVDSRGRLYNDDMVIVTSKASTSIARRNVILNAVPRPLWYPIYERALYIVRGSQEQLADRRDKAIKALAQFGVELKRILLYLGISKPDEIGVEHIPTLRGMYTQLRDGAVTVEEMFDPRHLTGTGFEQVANPLGQAGGTEDEDDEVVIGPATQSAETAAAPAAQAAPQTPTATPPAEAAAKPAETAQDTPAAAARPAPAADAKPAQDAATAPAEAEKPAAAKTKAKPKVETQPAAGTAPAFKTPEQYCEHARAWITAATSPSAINEQWKGEREVRGNARVVGDQLTELLQFKNERIKALERPAQ
jgi:hypothetical protein